MSESTCPVCRSLGEVEYDCSDCNGTGYAPTEDNAFGQCHTCYGEGVAVQTCFKCQGSGVIVRDDEENKNADLDPDGEAESYHDVGD